VSDASLVIDVAVALKNSTPAELGARMTVDHGRTRGCSIGPVSDRPRRRAWRAIQDSAVRRHAGRSQSRRLASCSIGLV
jgi:hypothetical protein